MNALVATASNEQTSVTESLNENISRINDQTINASTDAKMTSDSCLSGKKQLNTNLKQTY